MPAFKVARALGIDSASDSSSFRDTVKAVRDDAFGARLLQTFSEKMVKAPKTTAASLEGLLDNLRSDLNRSMVLQNQISIHLTNFC
jgi:hypothetical protein